MERTGRARNLQSRSPERRLLSVNSPAHRPRTELEKGERHRTSAVFGRDNLERANALSSFLINLQVHLAILVLSGDLQQANLVVLCFREGPTTLMSTYLRFGIRNQSLSKGSSQ